MSADDRTDEGHFEGVDDSLLQFVRAHRAGMAVPAIVVKRALGKHWHRFHAEPAICVVLIVRSPTWVSPVMQACAKLAKWHHVIEGDFKTRIDTKAASDMASRLAGGDRVLCVYPANVPIPEFLAIAADVVVEIVDVEPSDISKSIRMVTGRRLRGLASIPHDLDLKAMSSIRKGSTRSACLRRILPPRDEARRRSASPRCPPSGRAAWIRRCHVLGQAPCFRS